MSQWNKYAMFVVLAVIVMLGRSGNSTASGTLHEPSVSDEVDPNQQVERGLTAVEMNEYVNQASAADRIVTDLTMSFDGTQMRFDAVTNVNKDKKPWIVQLNLKDAQYRAAVRKYKGEFDATIHRSLSAGGVRYHAVVWVQASDGGVDLEIPEGQRPETGKTGAALEPLNILMRNMLQENHVPGATVAVAFQQELLFERGFGYFELDPPKPMPPDATMRIASVSKPITAVGILLLAQDGALKLDDPALSYLARHPKAGFDVESALTADLRWKDVTVRHLLQHSGGTDREMSKDTVFQLPDISRSLNLKKLGRSNDMVRYQLGRPLDFDPGSKYVYSNIGYACLGRIIEAVSGETYEDFIVQRILRPSKMNQTRLARTRLMHRADDEVRYYTQREKKAPAVWNGLDGRGRDKVEMVSEPYGIWDIEVMDSHGGWTSTAADLLRFVMALEHPDHPLLNASMRREMLSPPAFDPEGSRGWWYGCGWNVRNVSEDGAATYWHTGLLAGTSTILVHRRDGYSWAVLFNCDKTKDDRQCSNVIDPQMHRAVDEAMR